MAGTLMQQLTFWILIILGLAIILVLAGVFFWYFMVYKRRKRWKVNLFEPKSDGVLHKIGEDVLEEKTRNWGSKTFYFFKFRKRIGLPPPDKVVDRSARGKESVDYILIERQFYPTERKVNLDYNNPEINKKISNIYDRFMANIINTKTKLLDKSKLHDKFMYIPLNKTLTCHMEFKPIPYDVQLTVQRQQDIHNEFFAKRKNFWDKWGTMITTVVLFVIIVLVAYLSYDHIQEVLKMTIGEAGKVANSLDGIAASIGIGKPPA